MEWPNWPTSSFTYLWTNGFHQNNRENKYYAHNWQTRKKLFPFLQRKGDGTNLLGVEINDNYHSEINESE
jgi:hypothetical protein